MSSATSITVRVPLAIRRRAGRNTVLTLVRYGGEAALSTRADPALVKALARAFRYQRLLDEGRYGTTSEMATAGSRAPPAPPRGRLRLWCTTLAGASWLASAMAQGHRQLGTALAVGGMAGKGSG